MRLDVLSQLGKTLEKECQLVRTILSPKFQSERYLNIEVKFRFFVFPNFQVDRYNVYQNFQSPSRTCEDHHRPNDFRVG